MTNSIEWFIIRLNQAKERTSKLEDRTVEKRMKKIEDSFLRDLWDAIKWIYMCIIVVPEERREDGTESLFKEVMFENFQVFMKETSKSRKPRSFKEEESRETTLRRVIITLSKDKDKGKILKASREKHHVTYKGITIRL